MKIAPYPLQHWLQLTAVVCLTASSGCTSVIGSAYLREAWLDAVEHAAETQADAKSGGTTGGKSGGKAARADEQTADDSETAAGSSTVSDTRDDTSDMKESSAAAWSPATLDEAVGEADHRLANAGGLSEAARSTLIATLKSTPRQDWPVVVEEFTAALAAVHIDSDEGVAAAAKVAEPVAPMPPAEAAAHTLATVPAHIPVEAPRTAAEGADQNAAEQNAAEQNAVGQKAAGHDAAGQDASVTGPAQPQFAVQNACFASRVRAWGVVDRFETAEFQPGQELIVYFELDQLTSRQSAEGHTTRIDTAIRLIGADGRRVHEWTFEPLEETCGSHRRDYFARYLVSVPASTPAGPCRLEVAVSDTIAGRTAHASLPLTVGGP